MKFKIEASGKMISAALVKNLEQQILTAVKTQTEMANTHIKERTRAGKDADDMEFTEYSESYKEYRIRKGRDVKPVDLIFTGRMSRAQKTRVKETKKNVTGELYFNSANEAKKAKYLIEGRKRESDGVQNARNFFAFGKTLTNRIINALADMIDFSKANK